MSNNDPYKSPPPQGNMPRSECPNAPVRPPRVARGPAFYDQVVDPVRMNLAARFFNNMPNRGHNDGQDVGNANDFNNDLAGLNLGCSG